MSFMPRRSPSLAALALIVITTGSMAFPIATLASPIPPVWAQGGPRISAALERMLRDRLDRGEYLPEDMIRRFGLDQPSEICTPGASPAPTAGPGVVGSPNGVVSMAPDVQVNDKSLDATCAGGCGNRPLGQAETSIGVIGSTLVASWNDTKGFCTGGAIQGYGTSTNGGASWIDHGDVPALPGGGRYRGDPVVAANPTNGRFYICGLYEGGMSGSGLALASGRFLGGGFTIDLNLQIAVGGMNFLDKEWMAVDPLSGNVYVSWTNFLSTGGDRIEFLALDSLGVALGSIQVLSSPAGFGNVQGSRPAVGPDGELYVVWYEYGYPISHHRIRRSDDFGATFGPEHTVADYYENGRSGAPGYRRTFAPTLPGIAVDHSNGPYRGRVYVTWDEAVNFYDTPLSLVSPISEVEDNGFFASATSFAVGDVLRGSIASSAEFDLFRFSGLKGQTVFFAADSTRDSTNLTLRLICESDTSTFENYRLLALTAGRFPSFAFTLPADGSFTLRLNGAGPTPGPYRLLTGFDTPSGDRATDHRDQFLATSDDGATWNTPVQLNDSEPGFDGIFPEVAVDGLGRVHVYWHDFRDDVECGALSFEYLVSSGDGGTTWGPNRKLSDETSFWSANACGTANQGDYQGITAEGATIYPLWADSRLGDPDVFFEATTMSMLAVCPTPATGVGTVERTFSVANSGNVEATIAWSLTDTRGWITPAGSPGVTLGAGGSVDPEVEVAFPPDCEAGEVDTLLLTLENVDVPGHVEVCVTTATCLGPLAVERLVRALELAAPRPNPSRGQVVLRFGLSRTGQVRLGVFGAHGERVRSLVNADHEAGPHEISWDGRDDQGRRVGPGVYFVRLDAEGRSLRQVVTLLH